MRLDHLLHIILKSYQIVVADCKYYFVILLELSLRKAEKML